MILVKITGGLGNQIFQYGMYRYLKQKYPKTAVKVDPTFYHIQNAHNGFELDHVFHLSNKGELEIASSKEYYHVRGEIAPLKGLHENSFLIKVWAWTNARLRQRTSVKRHSFVIKESEYTDKRRLVDLLNNLECDKDWYIDGYWQNTDYFEDILDEIIADLTFPEITEPENEKTLGMIKSGETVAVHVRRGDYVGSMFDVLTIEYYQKAVEFIRSRLSGKNLVFMVFSEDVEWVKDHFGWLGEYHFIGNNKGQNSFRDLQLMSLCKHQITANSSFSIWSGYLNRNEDKIVCYPDVYSRDQDNVIKSAKGWVRIETVRKEND